MKIGRDGKGVREMSKKGREGGGRDGKGVVPLNIVGLIRLRCPSGLTTTCLPKIPSLKSAYGFSSTATKETYL